MINKDNTKTIIKLKKNINICYNQKQIPKPILKWVGGKTQIMDEIIKKFPKEINNYYEFFLGGGSVLLTLLYYVHNKLIKINGSINVYDINESLIYTYKNIQNNHIKLYDEIINLINEYNSCSNGLINRKPNNINEAIINKENYYYWIRNKYNNLIDKKTILSSAIFIFLNKTCFRGVYRVGPNGFNVPYGNYNNPEIINKEHLENIHNLIQKVNFVCIDFNNFNDLNIFKDNDFIYFDPPYAPEKKNSFVGYTKNGFTLKDHNNLFDFINNLNHNYNNIKIMLSNSDVELIHNSFKNNKFNIKSILCKRSINSKNPESKTKEVIITNYIL